MTAAVLALWLAPAVQAQTLAPRERLCDPTFEDCRADILTYIQQETQQIDMGFWMMSDARYSHALIAARDRGVTIRVLMDPRCSASHPACVPAIDQLAAAGIPMRNRVAGGIMHWKMILFASQEQVEFSGANYVPFETTPHEPWVNYTDEIIYFSNDPAVVRSMMTRFDDLWTSTTEFADYANITAPLTRSYPTYPLDPERNFGQSTPTTPNSSRSTS
jgi:phosphatidylserine/phosphatidylglycerophosphate/cardiolipin synthase-like enzyme